MPTSIKILRPLTRTIALAATFVFLSCSPPTRPPGGPGSLRGHTAGAYLTGIGDENHQMFGNPLWQRLGTKIVRYVAPYDTAVKPYWLGQATAWIHAAETQHEQVLVAFYHSEYTPTKMPSVASYQSDVGKFVKLFPHVRQYQPWNEANRGNVAHSFSSPSAVAAAKYYQALIHVCKGCMVIGLDVLDGANITPTLRYISRFRREIRRLKTLVPKISGLHNYSDINRLEDWRTTALTRALGGQVWLTETGGLVQFGREWPNKHGSGLARAAKVLEYMFALARSQPRIKRLYIYNWTGATNSTRFDAGLMNAHEQPRAGYVVVCRELHAPECNSIRVADN